MSYPASYLVLGKDGRTLTLRLGNAVDEDNTLWSIRGSAVAGFELTQLRSKSGLALIWGTQTACDRVSSTVMSGWQFLWSVKVKDGPFRLSARIGDTHTLTSLMAVASSKSD